MSTYRKIHGRSIQAVTTDPSESVAEGQVWYNTTSDTFKSIINNQAWASSSPLGSARYDAGGAGIQTAGLCFGGRSPAIPSTALTEEYNGSGWTSGGNLNLGRQQMFAFGSQTAAVGSAGYKDSGGPGQRAETEEYNGTSWSEVTNVPINSFAGAGFGVLTAGVACGGRTPSPTNSTAEYDGTNWTSGGNMTDSLQQLAGAGTLTAGVTFGGHDGTGIINIIQEYDGTSWSDAGDLPAARSLAGTSGIQTAAIIFGGNSPSVVNTTLNYDGTSISSNPATLATARYGMSFPSGAPASTNTEAFAAGGYTTATVGITEEYNSSVNVITAAAWSSGGSMNTARGGVNGTSGDKSAGATFGGQVPGGRSNATELYDGSSWTNGTNTPAARRTYLVTGTQTASLLCGGQPPTPTANGDAETFEFDGSSFTDTGNINNARDNAAGAGTQTAGLAVGGRTRPGTTFVPNNNVEEYDGSSWTTATALPAANASSTSATGPQTAAIFGLANPAYVASYDGTNWTTITATQAMPNSYTGTGVAGTDSSNAYLGGGEEPGGTRHGFTQKYDGTSWATQPSFATARNSFGYSGTSPAQLICGGQADPGYTANTEEFSVETTALNVKTLTQS